MIQTRSRGATRLFPSSWFCKRREGDNARAVSFFIIYYLVEERSGLFGDVPLAASMEAPVTSLGSVELENLTLEEKGLGDI